jgi:hypothetical protein
MVKNMGITLNGLIIVRKVVNARAKKGKCSFMRWFECKSKQGILPEYEGIIYF